MPALAGQVVAGSNRAWVNEPDAPMLGLKGCMQMAQHDDLGAGFFPSSGAVIQDAAPGVDSPGCHFRLAIGVVAVPEQDAPACNVQELMVGQMVLGVVRIVVAMHRYDGGDFAELIQNPKLTDVAGV